VLSFTSARSPPRGLFDCPGSLVGVGGRASLNSSVSYVTRAGGVTQVVEHLPSKCEALSSNPITTKKKKSVTSVASFVNTMGSFVIL
jgi:hypothetical protein